MIGKNASDLLANSMEMENIHLSANSLSWGERTDPVTVVTTTVRTQIDAVKTAEWSNILAVCGAIAVPAVALYAVS